MPGGRRFRPRYVLAAAAVALILILHWKGERELDAAEDCVAAHESKHASPYVMATATWYARPTDRWYTRIPALGLRDGTRRTIADYARFAYCAAVPIHDTALFPLGTTVTVHGELGTETALVADVNAGTSWDLEARLFRRVCGGLSRGVATVRVERSEE